MDELSDQTHEPARYEGIDYSKLEGSAEELRASSCGICRLIGIGIAIAIHEHEGARAPRFEVPTLIWYRYMDVLGSGIDMKVEIYLTRT